MTSAKDVAAYILEKQGSMTAMKLQKLLYYSQAWHLVWTEERLFSDKFEAWANGPVAPSIYQLHRQRFMVDRDLPGLADAQPLDGNAIHSVDAVLQTYGPMTPLDLSELTHREAPWREARGDAAPGERSTATITEAAMAEYYEALYTDQILGETK